MPIVKNFDEPLEKYDNLVFISDKGFSKRSKSSVN